MDRRLLRLIIISVCSVVVGCQGERDNASGRPRSRDAIASEAAGSAVPAGATSRESPQQQPVDHLAAARRSFQIRNWDAAAEAAYKALLQDPKNADATLIASRIEAARGNHQVAADLAGSIDSGSRLAKAAIEIQSQQLAKLNRISEAADNLLAGLKSMPEMNAWRHEAWRLLNQVGRREEASTQALALCRSGLATEQELLSLISRTISFPSPGMLKNRDDGDKAVDNGADLFSDGLGKARWYFSLEEHRRALDELADEHRAGFRSAAADALYGRLLAESQRWDEFRDWSVETTEPAQQLGDYWAALGNFFIDHHQYEASARALLEAVFRNPTDRVSVQRLAKVFDALARPEDGMQFRRRGIEIAQSERLAEALVSPSGGDAPKKMMRQMLELDRPFETLAWTLMVFPADATAERESIRRQREALLRSKEALVMAAESSLLGIDLAEFSVEPAYQELLRGGKSSLPKPRSIDVEPLAQPRLVNVASKVGLDFQWYQDLEVNIASIPIHESVGGGIAVIDYDLDGWPDVYLAQGSGEPPSAECTRSNALLRNVGARFTEVTSLAGVEDFNFGSGLAAGDVNQDGFADLYVGSLGHNRLLINNGDGTFRDDTARLGELADRFTTSLAIADINGDALPDLFEANYIEMDGAFDPPQVGEDGREIQPSPLKHYAQSDRWFENSADGRFQLHEITREVALPGTSLGLVVTDFDGDGSNEVFVGNDVRPNHFLVQTGDNQFFNAADAKGVANGFSGAANGCMGIATGDFNGDGTLDLHITNFNLESNNLYLQNSEGGFTDLAIQYGIDQISQPYVGFGTKAIDIDRNGWLDLIITNGHIFDMRSYGEGFQMPPQFLMGRGSRFELVSVDDDSGYWDQTYLGRSIAIIDFDRDGAVDFLVSHLDQPMALLHNQTQTKGRGLQFELVGTTSERDAIGARVVVTTGEQQQTQWVTAGDGYFCSDEAIIDFGLGTGGQVTRVDVHWPSGRQQTFRNVGVAARYLVVEGESELYAR